MRIICNSKRYLFAVAALVAAVGAVGLSPVGGSAKALASTKSSFTIGYSQAWTGNTFRKQNDANFVKVMKAAEKSGQLASYTLLDAGNSVSTQVSQVDDLILKHVSLIAIDPSSSTGLNGAIAKAHQAGIPVLVVSDGPVTSNIPYEIYGNYAAITEAEAAFIVKRLHGVGNVLEIQGLAGNGASAAFQSGMAKGFKAYPGIKIVGSVYGSWTESVAQSAVAAILPSLPKVDAVITATVEALGAIQAFQAAGRPVPLAIGDGCACFAQWALAQAKKPGGYVTTNYSPDPGIGTVAAYVALDILNHVKVPKTMIMPFVTVPQSQFAKYKNFPSTYTLQGTYTNAWVEKNLLK
jgi:ribose transport system substrate-binding protein